MKVPSMAENTNPPNREYANSNPNSATCFHIVFLWFSSFLTTINGSDWCSEATVDPSYKYPLFICLNPLESNDLFSTRNSSPNDKRQKEVMNWEVLPLLFSLLRMGERGIFLIPSAVFDRWTNSIYYLRSSSSSSSLFLLLPFIWLLFLSFRNNLNSINHLIVLSYSIPTSPFTFILLREGRLRETTLIPLLTIFLRVASQISIYFGIMSFQNMKMHKMLSRTGTFTPSFKFLLDSSNSLLWTFDFILFCLLGRHSRLNDLNWVSSTLLTFRIPETWPTSQNDLRSSVLTMEEEETEEERRRYEWSEKREKKRGRGSVRIGEGMIGDDH